MIRLALETGIQRGELAGTTRAAEVAATTGHKTWTMLRSYTQLRAEDLAQKLD